MPFNGFENFEACVAAQVADGKSEEEARQICGRLQADAEGGGGGAGDNLNELNSAWVEVFRAGDYGDRGVWTDSDLDRVAASYNTRVQSAPVVLGHPEHDSPAFGWVKGLRRAGQSLWAQLEKVNDQFAQAVKDGRFPQRSVSLYKHFPATGGPYLRHLGFLGATIPAVKGLAPIKFADGDYVAVDFKASADDRLSLKEDTVDPKQLAVTVRDEIRSFFSDLFGSKKKDGAAFTEEELNRRIGEAVAQVERKFERQFAEQKKAQEQARNDAGRQKAAAFIEKLKAANHWVPAFDKAGLPQALEVFATGEAVTFAEGEGDKAKQFTMDRAGAYQALCAFLEQLPALVPTKELAKTARRAGKLIQFNEPGRHGVIDEESVTLAEAAKELAAKEKISYGEALQRVRREGAAAGGLAAGQA